MKRSTVVNFVPCSLSTRLVVTSPQFSKGCFSGVCRQNDFIGTRSRLERSRFALHDFSGKLSTSLVPLRQVYAVRELFEQPSEGVEENNPVDEEKRKRRVYVGNIPYTVRWQEIKDHMREAGPVQYVHLFTDNLRRSKGSALVEYMTEEAAQRAIETLHNSILSGRPLVVREDKGSIFPEGERRIYRISIHHLVPNMRWQELRQRCKPFGNVIRAIVYRSKTSDDSYGVVFYPRLEQAQKALDALNGAIWDGRQIECQLEHDEPEFSTFEKNDGEDYKVAEQS
eukprot:jgi/Galph1/4779/GphlegSOOS_G3490.1